MPSAFVEKFASVAVEEVDVAREGRVIDEILTFIYNETGYDFRSYCRAHIKRRLQRRILFANLTDLTALLVMLRRDRVLLEFLLEDFSICVTEMFRDPNLFRALRDHVIPYLETQPFVKIWIAGCASGEEAYSLAILLKEAGLYDRSLIYATDINAGALKRAQEGIFNVRDLRIYTENYLKAGGTKPFVNYYTAFSGLARLNEDLKKNILFSHHSLVSDGSFGEMHLILCRNVMIYFDRELHNRVFRLFNSSLAPQGFLVLGLKESLRFSCVESEFDEWVPETRIYRRRA